jgi:NMD protein affecting ribosome stability and mRNA decay
MSQHDVADIDIEIGEPIYECPDCGSLTIRGKWAIEGARTLSAAARMLRDYAHELEHMRAAGLELCEPVTADYGVVRPGGIRSDDAPTSEDDE